MALKPIVKQKVSNEGRLAEAILGAAIVAKLALREPDGKIGRVGPADVKKVLNLIRKVPYSPKGVTKTQVKVDFGGSAKDRIIYKLNLGKVMMKELAGLKDLSILDHICVAAASYVNTPRIDAVAEVLYNNNNNNEIEIDVDGLSDNKGTKADINVRVDKWTFDKISLKASSRKSGHSLGQVGGSTWLSVLKLFSVPDTSLNLQIGSKPNEARYMKMVTQKPNFNTVANAVRWVYGLAATKFNSMSANAKAHGLYQFLNHHATRNDEQIRIVILRLGKHKTLNMMKLQESLFETELKAVVRRDTMWPVLLIYDASASKTPPATVYSENVIIAMRPKKDPRTEGYIVHLIEEGPQFSAMLTENETPDYSNTDWYPPSRNKLKTAMEQTASALGIPVKALNDELTRMVMTPLANPIWMKIANSKSFEATDINKAKALMPPNDLETLIKAFAAGTALPTPVLLQLDTDAPYVLYGDQTLIAARAVGMQPKVVTLKILRRNLKTVV